MIRTVGFQSHILSSVTENIDKFVEDMTKQHGSTFRLIDIKLPPQPNPWSLLVNRVMLIIQP